MNTDQSGAAREMPHYKCHKEVWALKIAEIRGQSEAIKPTIAELESLIVREGSEGISIEPNGTVYAVSGAEIVPADDGFAPFPVSAEYIRKHKPQVGGYYVRYKDGYESFSPAAAFESGYSKIE